MENASKALLMAAGVLIGVLVLSLASYLFVSFGLQSKEMNEQITSNQLTMFNTQFTKYAGEDNIVSIHDIISVNQLAKENNKKYEEDTGVFEEAYQVKVHLQGSYSNGGTTTTVNKYITEINEAEEQEYLEGFVINSPSNVTDGKATVDFKCVDIKYHDNGRVSEIWFKKI